MAVKPWLSLYDTGVPHTIDVPDMPLPQLLHQAAQTFPTTVAIRFYGYTMTYARLEAEVLQFAYGLAQAGVMPGERVMLLLPNIPQAVIGYYGALLAGAVVVLVNPVFDADQLLYQLIDAQVETVIALSMFHGLLREALELMRQRRPDLAIKRVVYTNLKEYLPRIQRQLFTLLRQEREGHRVPQAEAREAYWMRHLIDAGRTATSLPRLVADAAAVILYTGGTTGAARGVVHTHRSLYANVLQTRAWFTTARPGHERVLCVVPFSHAYGMTTGMNLALALASAMILLPTFETRHVLYAIRRERPTLFPGVPPMYAALNEVRDARRYRLDSLKACLSGAAPLPVEVQEGFERITRGRLVEGYGLTEAGPVTHGNPIMGPRRVGHIGLPLPDTEARIVDLHTDQDLPPGEIGELLVRGPQVMQGYWQRPDETAAALTADGWLRTGDVARMSPDGYFQLIQRKKDMIVAGPYNIYPRDVEEVLYEHPQVLDAAVVGVRRPDGTPAIKAFVVLRPQEHVTAAEVQAFLRERLQAPLVPNEIEFRAALPRSFVGKVLRRLLVEEE